MLNRCDTLVARDGCLPVIPALDIEAKLTRATTATLEYCILSMKMLVKKMTDSDTGSKGSSRDAKTLEEVVEEALW